VKFFLLECLFGRLFATISTDWTSASNYAFFNASIELLETNFLLIITFWKTLKVNAPRTAQKGKTALKKCFFDFHLQPSKNWQY
jgi:hypothetical protein